MPTPTVPSPRGSLPLRVAVTVEDLVQRVLLAVLSRAGRRQVAVLPYVGHGSPGRVHIRGRVVLGRSAGRPPATGRNPNGRRVTVPAGRGKVARRRAWRTLGRSLARFLTVELPGATVTVHVPSGPFEARCDREGYVDAVVEGHGLRAGWHDVRLTATWHGRTGDAVARVLVVAAGAGPAVISDVDDTVIETGLTRGLAFLRLTLLTEVTDREPLPGAAELYRALTEGPARGPVFYLSTSPWNLHDLLLEFLALRSFPAGPLLLTDWGPGRGALFRIPAEEHKLTLIRQVLDDHPGLRLLLVGDTGQIDPEIYARVAAEAPDRIAAIYVRRTAGAPAERAAEVDRLAAAVSAEGVPMLVVDDSARIAEHAHGIGLLDRLAIETVRAASAR
jgi:phosphatidate phosphatase APP1